ncbi:galectin-related protein-like [Salarias fasciatus]|uniref:galectin-related protein-like n=1 Tax=Salarias fasciatus TaxID=181472 RepID=UPI001176C991|nr:galectin-related protein-like [Salarias fasciatus]
MADSQSVTRGRKKWSVPQRAVTDQSKAPSGSSDRDSGTTLSVPFRGHISGGLRPGKKLVVFGIVSSRPDRFYLALTCGRGVSGEPPLDVAVELCVQFREQQVLRRACRAGAWTEAERTLPFFPFIRDQPFKMEVQCEQSRLRVSVDGQQLFDFNHRVTALGSVDTLWIKGSVSITKLA